MIKSLAYITRQQNAKMDQLLMGKYAFLSQTLMEIAGLAVAHVVHHINQKHLSSSIKNIGILVGPGNNGGDGLVAGRHLKMMGYKISLYLFKNMSDKKNENFLTLCKHNQIPYFYVEQKFKKSTQNYKINFLEEIKNYDLIIDAIFGFPYQGEFRQPYNTFIPLLKSIEDKILSVDIPSGWDANLGNIKNIFYPKYLVSLGLPKIATKDFQGLHYLGGRFIPQKLAEQLSVEAPYYEGSKLFIPVKQ